MKRRIPVWLVLAALFTLANIAGGVYAGALGEFRHAGLHFVLTIVGALVTWALAARRRPAGTPPVAMGGASPELSSRLTNLEQSLDAIAVAVERVGEGQRFMTRLFTERSADGKPR
jgi:hypothetical protein